MSQLSTFYPNLITAADIGVGTASNVTFASIQNTPIGSTLPSTGVFATLSATPAANTTALTSTGYSLTGSNAQSLVDLAGTWNTTGTPSAIKLNITNTASNASSLLLQLQTGGSNRFTVNASGDVSCGRIASGGTASGTQAVVSGGSGNTASGFQSTIIGGRNNTASSDRAMAGGDGCNANSNSNALAIGSSNNASGTASCALGDSTVASGSRAISVGFGSRADRFGFLSHAAGTFAANGDAQRIRAVLRCTTTTNAPVEMALDGSTTYLTIPSGKVMYGEIYVVGVRSTGADVAIYRIVYAAKNVAGLSTEVFSSVTADAATGTSLEVATVDAGDYIRIRPTGVASQIWRWVAKVDMAEVAYGT